jgi:hypothetical protein
MTKNDIMIIVNRSKMHRSYNSILPTHNRLLQKKWDDTYYNEHRRKVSLRDVLHSTSRQSQSAKRLSLSLEICSPCIWSLLGGLSYNSCASCFCLRLSLLFISALFPLNQLFQCTTWSSQDLHNNNEKTTLIYNILLLPFIQCLQIKYLKTNEKQHTSVKKVHRVVSDGD